jgi:hypothetical protein
MVANDRMSELSSQVYRCVRGIGGDVVSHLGETIHDDQNRVEAIGRRKIGDVIEGD